jgi:methionine--tRNA ligase beta chain
MLITIDDFQKINMCVGKIVSAEKIPGKQKILKARIDIGTEIRDVIVGAAEYYTPEELVNKIVIICSNLFPRLIGNVTSNGMLLAVEDADGRPLFLTLEGDAPLGSIVR